MSVDSKMTAIADKIRSLLGITGTMGMDAMATNLGTEQTNIANAFTAVSNKGGTVPSSKVSGNLASAINSIPKGVTIQRKNGTLKTNSSGMASVNCGFKPDLVVINGGSNSGVYYFVGAAFYEGNVTKISLTIMPSNTSSYVMTMLETNQTSNGFSVTAKNLSPSFVQSNDTNRSLPYIALKYT